ncbi:MAG: hypothetical protein HYU86_08175 [Chloroflexi bacterium]|nr:hypothetical protein [Chloroflexota bacterium]
MDPQFLSGIENHTYYVCVFDSLTHFGRDLQVVPGLATSWKALNDTTWEFKLRQGVVFHNGEEFDAETVKFSIERVKDPQFKSAFAGTIVQVSGLEVKDKYTIHIITSSPDPLLLKRLADSGIYIVPRKYIEANGHEIMKTKPIGTGPYKFVKWVKDEVLELEIAFPDHYRKPKAKRILTKGIPQEATRVAALQTGAADIVWDVSADLIKKVEETSGLKIKTAGSVSVPHIQISQYGEGPLRDKRVRQALNYAVDRESIVKNLFLGYYKTVPSPLVPMCFGYDDALKPYPYDPKKAKELLAAAGYPSGFELIFTVPASAYPKTEEYVQAIANYLAEVGVKAKLKFDPTKSFDAFSRELRTTEGGPEGIFHVTPGCTPNIDADDILWRYYYTWDAKLGSGNRLYFSNQELDRLIQAARSTLDQEQRKKLYAQALRIVQEEAYAIFLWEMPYHYGFNSQKLKDIYPRTYNLNPWDVEPA